MDQQRLSTKSANDYATEFMFLKLITLFQALQLHFSANMH